MLAVACVKVTLAFLLVVVPIVPAPVIAPLTELRLIVAPVPVEPVSETAPALDILALEAILIAPPMAELVILAVLAMLTPVFVVVTSLPRILILPVALSEPAILIELLFELNPLPAVIAPVVEFKAPVIEVPEAIFGVTVVSVIRLTKPAPVLSKVIFLPDKVLLEAWLIFPPIA